jgi:putative endonuclease
VREEDLACRFLEARGLVLLERNFRVKGGELDLVMREGDTLVIVEVRKRTNRWFGTAAESVDGRKQARLLHAAACLLARRSAMARMPVRFDVVAIGVEDQIDWIRGAFDAG